MEVTKLRAKSSRKSIPSLPITSLSAPGFRWIHREGWISPHIEYVTEVTQQSRGQIFSHRVYASDARRLRPEPVGRWLLIADEQEKPLLFAEASASIQKFRTLEIRFYGLASVTAYNARHIQFFISALLLGSEADIVRVFGSPDSILTHFDGSGARLSPIDTPLAGEFFCEFDHKPLLATQMVSIDPHTWWASESSQKMRKELNYIATRVQRSKREEAPPRRRQGFLSKLFPSRRR